MSKWFIKEDDPEIFNVTYGYSKKLEKFGGATQAKNDLDKDVVEVKALVTKIGDLSELTFKHKNFYMMKVNWFLTRFTRSLIKNYKYIV